MARTKKSSRKSSGRAGNGRTSRASSNRKSNGRSATRRHASRAANAVTMLREDHAKVQEMFDRFERTRGDEQKEKLAEKICSELEVHTKLEEEIFYPAVREAIDDDEMMEEATVEHQSAKDLIKQIKGMSAGSDRYDATVKVLGEYIKHHIKEEHNEMFPKARKSGVDLNALGEKMKARKEKLTTGGFFRMAVAG
jgi:hemerythrin-like domain-containing protein